MVLTESKSATRKGYDSCLFKRCSKTLLFSLHLLWLALLPVLATHPLPGLPRIHGKYSISLTPAPLGYPIPALKLSLPGVTVQICIPKALASDRLDPPPGILHGGDTITVYGVSLYRTSRLIGHHLHADQEVLKRRAYENTRRTEKKHLNKCASLPSSAC